jgi:antitoxin component YwqK of YwqJK toxin-antitoxin module
MPKSLIYSFIIFLFFSQCQHIEKQRLVKNYVNIYGVDIKMYQGITYIRDTAFSGVLYGLFPATKDTMLIKNYVKGKEEGEWKEFYENKTLKEIRYFVGGKKEGQYLAWWQNGNKKLDYSFQNNEYQGICKEWNSQGLLIKEANYAAGHELGTQKTWYDNGKIKANYVIINGRRYGLLGTKNCKNVSDSIF